MNKKFLRLTSICFAATGLFSIASQANITDKLFDYQTNPDDGQWQLWWSSSLAVSGGNDATTCDAGTPLWDSVNQNYVIQAQFNAGCTWINYTMNFPHALDGSVSWTADIKVEAISGTLADAEVGIGESVNYTGFGWGGTSVESFFYNINNSGPQNIGGDMTTAINNNRAVFVPNFALSTASDFMSDSIGPALYVKSKGTHGPLSLRITIDNVHIITNVSPLDSAYTDAETQAATDYYNNRASPALSALDTSIQSAKQALNNLNLSNLSLSYQQALSTQINNEANSAVASHNDIINSANNRWESIKVPTQKQYDQDVANLDTLNNLMRVGNFANSNTGPSLIYYPWEATGSQKLNDLSLAISTTAQQTNPISLSLNELEPLSVVLQNLYSQDVTINHVSISSLSNQFSEVFPSDHIDIRVVKNWYVGSATSIAVSYASDKVRVPELLLKDDALVKTDDVALSNSLRITTAGSQIYQNVSSPTAQMPNDATTYDATTLQRFLIPALHAKQLWLTLDTRTAVRPGNYSGNIAVLYHIAGDGAAHTLQIPLSIFVAPVSLQKSDLLYSLYYGGKIGTTSRLQWNQKSQQQYVAEMKDMLAHGVDHPTQNLDGEIDSASQIVALQNEITLREQAGLACDKYFLADGIASIINPTSTDNSTNPYTNASRLKNSLRQTSSCASSQLYMYGADESGNGTTADQATVLNSEVSAMKSVHYAGAKTFVAGYTGTFDHIGSVLDTFNLSGTPNDAEISQWRQAKKDVYSYNNPQAGVPDPFVYRSNFGLLLWQHGYTGAMDYAYQDGQPDYANRLCTDTASSYCSMWNDFDNAGYYDHVFAYPTTNGVIDTIQWEGFREAVDDTRYLATLKTLMQSSSDSALAAEINNWLATIKTQTHLDPIAARKTMQNYFQRLNKPPVLSNVSVTASGNMITAKGQASDPEGYLGLVEVKLDNGNWQSAGPNTSWQLGYANVIVGSHTLYYRATDYWGASTQQQSTIDVGTHGLTGVYYNNTNLASPSVLTRTDANINFNWGVGSPATGINSDNFSVRWTGKILPPVTGNYTFCSTAEDGVRLSINGIQVIDQWRGQFRANRYCSPAVALTQNVPTSIQMDYFQGISNASAVLTWSYPNQAEVVIPTSQLYTQ